MFSGMNVSKYMPIGSMDSYFIPHYLLNFFCCVFSNKLLVLSHREISLRNAWKMWSFWFLLLIMGEYYLVFKWSRIV